MVILNVILVHLVMDIFFRPFLLFFLRNFRKVVFSEALKLKKKLGITVLHKIRSEKYILNYI